jgi:hypothetical protein
MGRRCARRFPSLACDMGAYLSATGSRFAIFSSKHENLGSFLTSRTAHGPYAASTPVCTTSLVGTKTIATLPHDASISPPVARPKRTKTKRMRGLSAVVSALHCRCHIDGYLKWSPWHVAEPNRHPHKNHATFTRCYELSASESHRGQHPSRPLADPRHKRRTPAAYE